MHPTCSDCKASHTKMGKVREILEWDANNTFWRVVQVTC